MRTAASERIQMIGEARDEMRAMRKDFIDAMNGANNRIDRILGEPR